MPSCPLNWIFPLTTLGRIDSAPCFSDGTVLPLFAAWLFLIINNGFPETKNTQFFSVGVDLGTSIIGTIAELPSVRCDIKNFAPEFSKSASSAEIFQNASWTMFENNYKFLIFEVDKPIEMLSSGDCQVAVVLAWLSLQVRKFEK